jgi:hypothetical protein
MAQQASTTVRGAVRPANHALRWPILGALTGLAVLGAFGNAWDLYWHIMVGRDTFWIPPHTMMYTAVALSGLTATYVVLAETLAPSIKSVSTMVGFRAPLGYFILGLGALQMALSAPFDDWWHRIYGVDVTVWSPPHLAGFSGAIVMLSGITIALLAQRNRSAALSDRQEWLFAWWVALLFALVVRWVTFLNSTTLQLSWMLEPADFAVAGPWAPWWGLWAGLFMAWTFVASARCLPGRQAAALPLLVCLWALVLRAVEFPLAAVGFHLSLPWGDQTLRRPFRPFLSWDLGLWVTTAVLILPAFATTSLRRLAPRSGSARFGLIAGAIFGLLLAAQFLLLRQPFHLVPLNASTQLEVLGITTIAGISGGLIGAAQGDWLARFRR